MYIKCIYYYYVKAPKAIIIRSLVGTTYYFCSYLALSYFTKYKKDFCIYTIILLLLQHAIIVHPLKIK